MITSLTIFSMKTETASTVRSTPLAAANLPFVYAIGGNRGCVIMRTVRRNAACTMLSQIIFGLTILVSSTTGQCADTLKVIPKESFEFNLLITTEPESLWLVTCGDFVYFPFGEISSKAELSSGLLKRFHVASTHDTMVNGVFELHRLVLGSSKLILWFDDDSEATIESYILSGEIIDSSIHFINGIHVGSSLETFLATFLSSFPESVLKRCSTVIFESCVTGIRHVYYFRNGQLARIRFECVDCSWKL